MSTADELRAQTQRHVVALWRQARETHPEDRERAVREYRKLLDKVGERRLPPNPSELARYHRERNAGNVTRLTDRRRAEDGGSGG